MENEEELKNKVKEIEKSQAKKKPRPRKKQVAKKTAKSNPVSNFHKLRPFPKVTLEEALQVPLKIKVINGGNPWDVEDLAKALNVVTCTRKITPGGRRESN
ncbi:MAG TPA: hypothetical protein VGD05_05455 [Pyrinomonadaceae bacterium]